MDTAPDLLIYYTRAFEGPMHDRVYALWDRLAKRIPVVVGSDCGSHEASFRVAWKKYRTRAKYLLLTEADFLHRPDTDFGLSRLKAVGTAALGVPYGTRAPGGVTRPDYHVGGLPKVGGWWVLIDTERAPEKLDFRGIPDPCNGLNLQMTVALLEGRDRGPSIEYEGIGLHLFWSRHWNDPPGSRPADFDLDKIRAAQKKLITQYEGLYAYL
ncbi:MAG: hypothetical protein V3S83_12350 [Gemmatimonadota bacterium]